MVRMFGPPITYWTARFESKHRVAKNTAAASKNVINISKTISERQQMRAVSIYYEGMFNSSDYTLPNEVFTKQEIIGDSDFNTYLKSIMTSSDLVCKSITVHNQLYKNGDLVVIRIEDSDNITVGLVKSFLVKNCKVYFVIQRREATRHWLRFFTSKKSSEIIFEYIESVNICDFKPLIMRGNFGQFVFTLHHHISFDYQ